MKRCRDAIGHAVMKNAMPTGQSLLDRCGMRSGSVGQETMQSHTHPARSTRPSRIPADSVVFAAHIAHLRQKDSERARKRADQSPRPYDRNHNRPPFGETAHDKARSEHYVPTTTTIPITPTQTHTHPFPTCHLLFFWVFFLSSISVARIQPCAISTVHSGGQTLPCLLSKTLLHVPTRWFTVAYRESVVQLLPVSIVVLSNRVVLQNSGLGTVKVRAVHVHPHFVR